MNEVLTAQRNLTALFEPTSVAVVGASNDLSKWGGDVSARLLKAEHRRRVYLVNGRGGEVLGRPAYPSLCQLPESPELVILAMPGQLLEAVVDDCAATGVKAVVAVTAMLGEMGGEGKAREARAVARLRAAGAVLVGPNCLGVADTGSELNAVAFLDVRPGPVGLISQSGGFGEELNLRLAEFGLGFSRFITIGNQADLDVATILRSFKGHEPTRAVVVYAEELRDGLGFVHAAHELVSSGTPVVLLAPGRSEASSRVAQTHTGSLTSDSDAVDAACRAAGVVRVNTQREAAETLVALLMSPMPGGRRVAVVSDGGGPGAICADIASLAGLSVAKFSRETQARLKAVLPENAECKNPIDFAAATYDPEAYERVIGVVADSGEIDAIVASGVIGFWGARFPERTELVEKERESLLRMSESVKQKGIPLLASTPESCPIVQELRDGHLTLYRDVESAVTTLARLVPPSGRPVGLPPVPAVKKALDAEGYWIARAAVAAAGVPMTAARRVCLGDAGTRAQAVESTLAAAHGIGYPVVLKAAGILHKSDVGGVILDLGNDEDLTEATKDLWERLSDDARDLAVEKMISLLEGVELLLGCRWDSRFGPLVTVAIGGIYTEILADTQTALAPVDGHGAFQMLQGLRGFRLLEGARGRPKLDIVAAAEALSALSRFSAGHPEVATVEVNPLLVQPQGAVGLDARLVLASSTEGDASDS
jgi:acyl-CoA synthetase (NDP forming)